jgi:hypothetical protein
MVGFCLNFFALNYLMKGLGASQTWVSTSSAEDLVENYEEFLHGNIRNRKVVLNDQSFAPTGRNHSSHTRSAKSQDQQELQSSCFSLVMEMAVLTA